MLRKFTLIELLMIMAIIGILATILLPKLEKSREKAIVAVCLSNQKQLAIAYTTYSTKNNHFAVAHRWYNSHSGTQGSHRWCDDPVDSRPLNEYLGSPEVSHCPADKGDPQASWNDHNGKTFGSSWVAPWSGSTMNMFKHSTNVGGVGGVSVLGFDRPDRKSIFHNVILRADRDWNDVSGKGHWHEDEAPRFPINFVDGHAEYFNFWWKKTKDYDPVRAAGKTNDLDWIIDNIKIY